MSPSRGSAGSGSSRHLAGRWRLLILILFTETPFGVVVAGARSGPCALRRRYPATGGSTGVSVRPQPPGGHRPHSRSRDPEHERERPAGTPAHADTCRYIETQLAGQRPNAICRSADGRRDGDAGRRRQEFPPSSNSTTPLHSRLHPCSGWVGRGPRGRAIGRQGIGAPGLIPARLVPRQPPRFRWRGYRGFSGGFSGGCGCCGPSGPAL